MPYSSVDWLPSPVIRRTLSGKFEWRGAELPEAVRALYARKDAVDAELSAVTARKACLEVQQVLLYDLIGDIEENEWRRRVAVEREQDPIQPPRFPGGPLSEASIG